MKRYLKIFFLTLLLPVFATAQNAIYDTPTKQEADSLRLVLQNTNNDTSKLTISKDLFSYYKEINIDSALYFAEQELAIAQKLNQKLWQASGLRGVGYESYNLGNYPQALIALTEALKITEDVESEKNLILIRNFSKDNDARNARLYVEAGIHLVFSLLYNKTDYKTKAFSSNFEAINIEERSNNKAGLAIYYRALGELYLSVNKPDSAYNVAKKALPHSDSYGFNIYRGNVFGLFGLIYFQKENTDSAKKYIIESGRVNREQNNLSGLSGSYLGLSKLYQSVNQLDSAIYFAKKCLETSELLGNKTQMNNAYNLLYSIYQKQGNKDSTFFYLQLAKTLSDSLNKVEKQKLNQYQTIGFNKQLEFQEAEKKRTQEATTRKIYGLIFGLGLFSLIGLFLYRNNRQKQKANTVLQNTLKELKATQNQLIQSEKLASLGELTAGIAHEIQNPLNFVNNFSELSVGLAKDIGEEIHKPEIDKPYVEDLLKDLTANQKNINHHGKRAASIVSGMLEHSRTSTGKKEFTDVNKLADEYFRLSYHGLRAKNKDFNAEMISNFDTTIPKIEIIPQDVGRVILNLINNAFYAVNEKRTTDNGQRTTDGEKNYEPTVTVTTTKTDNAIEIKVKDNGTGMPENVKAKVFQPFFTTKPTGQGTGLGLSLAYDIITKGHSGSLKVESTEGVGSEFIISLPFKTNG